MRTERTKAGAQGNTEIYSLAFSHYPDAFCLSAFLPIAVEVSHTVKVCPAFNRWGITEQIVSSLYFQ